MNLRTFCAPSMAEALVQVKKEMGTDALILHTRTFQRRKLFGLLRREIVEITAGSGLNVSPRNGRRRNTAAAPSNALPASPTKEAAGSNGNGPAKGVGGVYGPHTLARSRAALQTAGATVAAAADPSSAPSAAPANARQGFLESPAVNSAVMLNLSNEVGVVKKMVADLMTETRAAKAPQVPEELFDYYLTLIQSNVAEQLASDVLKRLRGQLRPDQLGQPQIVREKLAELLEKMMPVSGPIRRKKTAGPHIVALIGPTGVGKTTTLAKLAANLKLHEGHSVGLITIDTYRIAAVDQLKKYADIIGSPLEVVNTPEELKLAIEMMADSDFILIDTAGRSPTDAVKLNELKSFMAAANPDEVHLVISTVQSQECIERAIDRFADVRVDKIIFTKFDEAIHVGVVLNVVRKVNKSLSYVTTGQNVPDDIEVGEGRRLARMILGAES